MNQLINIHRKYAINNLKIVEWNANGLSQHSKVKIFLETCDVDVLLMSETHFKTKTYFGVPCYNLYTKCVRIGKVMESPQFYSLKKIKNKFAPISYKRKRHWSKH